MRATMFKEVLGLVPTRLHQDLGNEAGRLRSFLTPTRSPRNFGQGLGFRV